MRTPTHDEILAAVAALISMRELEALEAAALAASPEECACIDAELDAWERAPLLSIAQRPTPIA